MKLRSTQSHLQAGGVIDHYQPPCACKKTATQIYLLIHQSRKTLYLDGGRLLGASTDWRILSPIILSISAVSQLSTASCLRFVDARNGFSFAGSPTGEEGGKGKPWKQRLRVKNAWGEEALNLNCTEKRTVEET
jgi:hypothetical protein